MDEVLIRRLLGGVVLIVLAWLVAALLPPPKPVTERDEDTVVIDLRPAPVEPVETVVESVDEGRFVADNTPLPQPSATPTRAAVPTPASAPRPGTVPTKVPIQARTPVATPRATPTPAPTATPAPVPPPVAAGQFWVQVGAYSTRENAEQVRQSLGVAGMSARVISAEVAGKQVHRVRIGPFKARAEADSAHARAVLLGYSNAQVLGT